MARLRLEVHVRAPDVREGGAGGRVGEETVGAEDGRAAGGHGRKRSRGRGARRRRRERRARGRGMSRQNVELMVLMRQGGPRVLEGRFCVSDRPPTKLATGNPSIDIFYNCNYKNYVSKSGTKWPSGSKVMAKTVSNVSLPF